MEKIKDKNHGNLGLAILASIGLGLAGCVLYAIVYSTGRISALVCASVAIFASIAYIKVYKKIDLKGLFIIFAICIVEILITHFLLAVVEVFKAYQDAGIECTFSEIFSITIEILGNDSELKSAYTGEVLMNVLFVLIGTCFTYIPSLLKYKKALKQANQSNVYIVTPDTTTQTAQTEQETQKFEAPYNAIETQQKTFEDTNVDLNETQPEKQESDETDIAKSIIERIRKNEAEKKDKQE